VNKKNDIHKNYNFTILYIYFTSIIDFSLCLWNRVNNSKQYRSAYNIKEVFIYSVYGYILIVLKYSLLH